MIKVLGKKRILLLAALAALNVLFAALVYLYLIPQTEGQEKGLKSISSKVKTVQKDLDFIQQEFDQLEIQKEQFEKLRVKGFFDAQKRRQAEDILQQIQKQSEVISAKASIGAGKTIENEEAKKAAHVVLESPINIRIEALDDVSIYNYVYLLENFFPGHLYVDDITMTRKEDVTGTALRSIAGGQNPPLVVGIVNLSWSTMIPESSVITNEGEAQR